VERINLNECIRPTLIWKLLLFQGTHIESPSTMFGTVICYLAVRLLGGNEDEDWITKGREFIQKEGGAVMTSSWAKFWLCLVGCMDWKGHNSVPPEMWLLPNWFPFHPGRLWCHCRMVYLPMGYLYGSRFIYSRAETDPLIKELRKEVWQCLFMLKYHDFIKIGLTTSFLRGLFVFHSYIANRMIQSNGILRAILLPIWTIIHQYLCL
jgi:hypothetical protein